MLGPGELNAEELRTFLEKHKTISCRHFHADESKHFKCPVAYDQTDFDFILKFCSEHNKKYYTLCNEAINIKKSICAGNILVLDPRNYFVEFFYGPGTPRDIEAKGPDELKQFSRTFGEGTKGDKPPDAVLKMVGDAVRFRPLENKAYILEFSVYEYPIGRNQTNIICWEWRWGWLHYQLQANQYLLEQLRRATAKHTELMNSVDELKMETKSQNETINRLRRELQSKVLERRIRDIDVIR